MANIYVVTLLLLCSICICDGKVQKLENGTLDFGKAKEVTVDTPLETDFDGKGLEPWYDVAKSFIHTVQKDDIPYGKTT